MYQSFQAAGKAITLKHPLLPYIDVRSKGYTLSPSECACREKGRYWSNSPPPSTPVDLGLTIVAPTPIDCPRHQWKKKKTSNIPPCSPSPPQEESNVQEAIPLDEFSVEMTL